MVHTIRVTSEIPKLGCGDTHSPPLLFCSHYTQACTRTWITCLDEHPRGLSASSVKAWEKPYRSDSTKSKYKCSPVFVNTCSFCILWKYALLPKYSCYSSCEGNWQIPKKSFQTIFEIHLLDHSHRDQHPCIFFSVSLTARCFLGLGLGMKRHIPQTSTSQRGFCACYKMVKKGPASPPLLHYTMQKFPPFPLQNLKEDPVSSHCMGW